MQEKLKDPIIKTGLPLIELHSEYDIFIAQKITPASVSLQVQLIVHLTTKLFITSLQKNNPHAITGRRNIDKHIPNIYLCITDTKMSNYYFPQQKKKYIYIYIKLLHILTIFSRPLLHKQNNLYKNSLKELHAA